MSTACLIALIVLLTIAPRPASANRLEALLMAEPFPGSDPLFAETLKTTLEKQGFAVRAVTASSLVSELGDKPPSRLLVLPNAAWFPADARPALTRYLDEGGNLLTLGGPPFSKQAIQLNGKWYSRETLLDELATRPPGERLVDFAQIDPAGIPRNTMTPSTKTTLAVASSGLPESGAALEFHAESVEGWEEISLPMQKPFPSGQPGISFWAKGNANTKRLIVGWFTSDGARWRAWIELSTTWKHYALIPDQFAPKNEPENRTARFDPATATRLSLCLENADLARREEPAFYAVTDLRALACPPGALDFTAPTIETMSPFYKTYALDATALVPTHGSYEELDSAPAIAGPVHVVCSLPRYRGLGFNKTAPNRWIPALCAREADGHIGGAAAALYVQDDGARPASVWATFGIEDPAFLAKHRDEIAREAASLAKRIDDGLSLLSAGVDRASYFEETPEAGAVVINLGQSRDPVEIECRITADSGGPVLFSAKKSIDLTGKRTLCPLGPVSGLSPGFYVVKTSMRRNGRLLDEIRQPFSIVKSGPVPKEELVTIKGDQFYYKGKPWYSLGINYRPIYVAAMEKEPFWQHWANPNQYDAEIIEQELSLMNKININTVGLIFEQDGIFPGIVDFMERAHRHGIKCHVFVGALHPLYKDPEKALELIKSARLWERPAMFAYDVAWEVRVGRESDRANADPHWLRWIDDRYGSLANAEADWQFALRKEPDGRVHGPTDDQITQNGPWDRMVAAYRRFWDDRISRKYLEVAQTVKSIDPIHPLSARSGYGGTGALFAVPQLPFDLLSGAKHLDYISPEGYNFGGEWPAFRSGGFTTLYAKLVSGGKPVYWAEFGSSATGTPTSETLEKQRRFYDYMYKVLHETRSAGSSAWWWPGYLIWEASDFAIINPDLTLRPAAHEFTKMARLAPIPERQPDHWIEIDRDLHANGYAGILQSKRAEYGQAVAEGKSVGLRTKGTHTDSASFPKLAVGNTPVTGKNPPKYLNAEFNALEIQTADGRWTAVGDGAQVPVKPNAPVIARASLGNLAEAKWLAPKNNRPGGVFLHATADHHSAQAPIAADTPFLADAQVPAFKLTDGIQTETPTAFQLGVGEIAFGEKWYITLVPHPLD